MAKSVTVNVKMGVLQWLRERSGWTREEVSEKLKIPIDYVIECELGKKTLTLSQLRVLSKLFNCSISSFLLSKPKAEKPLPKDYRSLPDEQKNIFDKKTMVVINDSRYMQQTSKELSENVNYPTAPDVPHIKRTRNPEEVSSQYRKTFDLSMEKQKKMADSYKLFGYLRDRIERLNILVLQFAMPIEDARGFVLTDGQPITIVINTKDSIEARIFTLMHEFGHVLLRDTAIDIPGQYTKSLTEIWCNVFAASFLLPKENAYTLFEENKGKLLDTKILNQLSKKYKVSKNALAVSMKKLGYISASEYGDFINRFERGRSNNVGKAIPINPAQRCISKVGRKYVFLVAKNFDEKLITRLDASDFLSIKTKYLEDVFGRLYV